MTATGVRVIGVLGMVLAMTPGVADAATVVARLTRVEGAVTIYRTHIPSPAAAGAILHDGDEVRTEAGRAEITFTDGSVLQLDRASRVAVYEHQRFTVIEGRVDFRSAAQAMGYQAQTDFGSVRVRPRGSLGILADRRGRQALVIVTTGEADVDSPWGRATIYARQLALLSGATGRPLVTPFTPSRGDTFDTWCSSRDRVAAATTPTPSPQYPSPSGEPGTVLDIYRPSDRGPSSLFVAPQLVWGFRRQAPHPGPQLPPPAPPHAAPKPPPPERRDIVIEAATSGRASQPRPRP